MGSKNILALWRTYMTERRITNNQSGFGDPFFIGFDDALAKFYNKQLNVGNLANYPPYNIVKDGDDHFLIELALAGFEKDDIEITLKGDILTVAGKVKEHEQQVYLHKGISTRSFERKFTLANTIEVLEADIQKGMLLIRLRNNVPEYKKEHKIPIGREQKSEAPPQKDTLVLSQKDRVPSQKVRVFLKE